MPDYQVTYGIRDAEGGTTSKTFKGTFADEATADAAVTALRTDLEAAMDAYVYQQVLSRVDAIAGAASGTRTVFRRGSLSLALVDKSELANFKIPAVNATINPTGSGMVLNAAPLTALVANFEAGGGWTISDGDVVESIVRGKAIFDRSGENF